jgi:hypothetical protein
MRQYAAPDLHEISILEAYNNIRSSLFICASQWRTVMRAGGFVEQLRLAEKAAEDIYFAKVDRELIDTLHKRMQAEKNFYQSSDSPTQKQRREKARLS